MDLSKLSTPDLQAIQAGKWDAVSTPGLQEYQRQKQSAQAPSPDISAKTNPNWQQAMEKNWGGTGKSLEDVSKGYADSIGNAMGAIAPNPLAKGSSKLADYLMQKSVGMGKYLPGAGNKLVDEGVVGTKGMMAGQVSRKLPAAERNVQELVGQLEGNVSTKDIADAVSQHAKKFQLSTGEVPENMAGELAKVQKAASGVAKVGGGEVSPLDALKLKRQGDYLGYTASGAPATATDAELGRSQADAARAALDKISNGASKEALSKEQALILANKGLNKPETISKSLPMGSLFGTALGTAIGGAPGGAAGYLASKAAASPLGQSLAAQGLQKVASPAIQQLGNPALLESLFKNSSSQPGQ